jgi:hypothetical protein
MAIAKAAVQQSMSCFRVGLLPIAGFPGYTFEKRSRTLSASDADCPLPDFVRLVKLNELCR